MVPVTRERETRRERKRESWVGPCDERERDKESEKERKLGWSLRTTALSLRERERERERSRGRGSLATEVWRKPSFQASPTPLTAAITLQSPRNVQEVPLYHQRRGKIHSRVKVTTINVRGLT